MMDVSVIIPIYNAGKSLGRCLDSVIGQRGVEIEVICVDDRSTDETEIILNAYGEKYGNIRVIRNSLNKGAGYSRNRGMEEAKGKYIQFLDADDYLLPGSISAWYQYAEDRDAQMCFFRFENDMMGQRVRKGIEKKYAGVCGGRDLAEQFIQNKEFFYYACGAVYRRDFLTENGIQFSKLEIGEGGDFVLHSLMYAQRVGVYDRVCYHYMFNPQSITNTNKQKSRVLVGQIYQYIEVLRRMVCNSISGWNFFLDYQYAKVKGGLHNLEYEEWKKVESCFEDDFSKHIADVLLSAISYKIDLSDEQICRLKHARNVVVYGAGYLSYDVMQMLSRLQVEMMGFAVTSHENNPSSLFGHRVFEIGELKEFNKEVLVVIGADKKYNESIKGTLADFGFDDCLFLDMDI